MTPPEPHFRGAGGRLRLFAAVPVPGAVRGELARIAADARAAAPFSDRDSPVRWTDPRGAHLTLKFIGAWPDGDAPRLGGALVRAVAGHAPFELALGGAGAFPARGAPRVLWVGVGGSEEAVARLHALRADVEAALAEEGCAPDPQPFRPHLTIGRVPVRLPRDRAAELRRAIAALDARSGAAFPVERVVLYRSTLTPQGSVYDELAAAALG